MIGWMFGDAQQNVSGDHKFVVDVTPKIAETSSNLTIICYPNRTKKLVLPIRVRWFRMKNNQLTEIAGIRGSTYPCEPSDLGCKIKAEVTSLEDDSAGTAEAWFGPIRMDITVKQVLAGVLSSGHTTLSIFVIKDKQKEGRLTISDTEIVLTDLKTEKTLRFEYSLAEPRVELHPRDVTRLYLRFREDNGEGQLKNFMGSIFEYDLQKSTRSQSLMFKNENKLQLKFLSRSSRDLLIFSIKAFSSKRDMKSSAIIEKIQRIDITKDELFNVFFTFESLRNDIVRLDLLNKELMADREAKTKDLKQMEEEIANLTTTYLKIIEDKCRQNRIDFNGLNESYSHLSQKRDDINNRNRLKQLQKQNADLKFRVRDLTEQVELLQFFKKGNNESVVHQSRHIHNPFEKKLAQREQPKPSMSVLQMSKINVRLLEQNNKLKEQQSRFEKEKSKVEMFNLLDSLHEHDQEATRIRLVQLQQAYNDLIVKYQDIQRQLESYKQKETIAMMPQLTVQRSLVEQSAILTSSMINQSMTSEAQINLLLEKFDDLKRINERLLVENERYGKQKELLRRENERLAIQVSQLKGDISRLNQPLLNRSGLGTTNPEGIRLAQENEQLQAEKRLLMKKLELISLESNKLKNHLEVERKCQELSSELMKGHKRIALLQEELTKKDHSKSMHLSQLIVDQSDKMKEINESLLMEITCLKRENQHLKDIGHQEAVDIIKKDLFVLQQQLMDTGVSGESPQHILQLYEKEKQIGQLKSANDLLQIKIKTQSQTIEKLMHQLHDKAHKSFINDLDSSNRSVNKYKRRIKQLQNQLALLQRSTDAINRSRDLSMDMEQYNTDTIERLSSELDMILKQNERISEMCEKYSKEAKDIQKVRLENVQLRRELETLQTRLTELQKR